MWLASSVSQLPKDRKETFFDRLLGLSPEITEGPEDIVLVPLTRVATYWGLQGSQVSPVFLAKLRDLHSDFGCKFICAPTAPWALWIHRVYPPQELLEFWDTDSLRRMLTASSVAQCEPLIYDHLARGEEARRAFEYLLDHLHELGLRDVESLARLPREALSIRFGALPHRLLQRVRGADDLPLTPYVPPTSLNRRFQPSAERLLGAENDFDLLGAFASTLKEWSLRLEARHAALRGVRVTLRSEWKDSAESFFVTFPRPLRDPEKIFVILREKWMASLESFVRRHGSDTNFEDELSEVLLESMGLERDTTPQLDLFDPHREARAEAWDLLVGRLMAKSTKEAGIRVGAWRPQESYLPEDSISWSDWNPKSCVPMIQEHPRRPLFLLPRPRVIRDLPLRSESDFIAHLEAAGALGSLERITELWDDNGQTSERSYARLGREWIFWDHHQKRAFVHGYFEQP
ncbi:MAG: hypothetical protein JST16_12965 [Bdellovibrionales bacterium]|nr:hypothetical protein [Bdellovibrionales bacterium]